VHLICSRRLYGLCSPQQMDGAPEAPAATTDADYGRVRRFKPQTTTLTRYSLLSLFSLYDFYRLSSISNGVDNAVIDLVLSTFKPELDPALRLTLYWPSPGISGFIIGFCWCNWTRVVTVTDALLPRSRPSLLAPLLCSRVLLSSCFRFDSPLRRSVLFAEHRTPGAAAAAAAASYSSTVSALWLVDVGRRRCQTQSNAVQCTLMRCPTHKKPLRPSLTRSTLGKKHSVRLGKTRLNLVRPYPGP